MTTKYRSKMVGSRYNWINKLIHTTLSRQRFKCLYAPFCSFHSDCLSQNLEKKGEIKQNWITFGRIFYREWRVLLIFYREIEESDWSVTRWVIDAQISRWVFNSKKICWYLELILFSKLSDEKIYFNENFHFESTLFLFQSIYQEVM